MRDLGWDEIAFLEYVKDKMEKEPTLLDIGFNRGYFTEEFLERFPTAKVYGFEPIKELFEQFATPYKDNENVRIVNCGLHNEICEKTIYFLQDGFDGMSSIHFRPTVYNRFRHVETTATFDRLDNFYFWGLPQIDYVKCDTEGNEYFVLDGARNLLEFCPPQFIQFEYGGCYIDSNTTGKQVVELLNQYNYTVLNRDFNVVTPDTFVEDYDLQNYLAVYNGYND
jgi:FkbM family methyltransferase